MYAHEKAESKEDTKGFERVIAYTEHTLVLNDPWDNPRPIR
eukprot:COSAG06_NODE_26929_length_604_cov_2.124752_2_plen_41_part_00